MDVAEKSTAPAKFPRQVPFTIRLSSSFVSSVQSEIRASTDVEIETASWRGGLLFGAVGLREVNVEAFKWFKHADVDQKQSPGEPLDRAFDQCFANSRVDSELASLDLIGWYRVRADAESELLNAEIEFHNRHFRRISDLALILTPDQSSGTLNLYTRWANTLMSIERYRSATVELANKMAPDAPVEVMMRAKVNDSYQQRVNQVLDSMHEAQKKGWKGARLLRNGLGSTASETVPKGNEIRPYRALSTQSSSHSAQATIPPLPANASDESTPKLRVGLTKARAWIGAVFLLLAVASAVTWLHVGEVGKPIRNHSAVNARLRQSATDLGMQVQSQGEALLLRWNPYSQALQSAKSAVLEISDGPRHREIYLNSSQIANGAILYTPVSNDVSVRLEALAEHGPRVSESMRVLDGIKLLSAVNVIGKPESRASSSSVTGTEEQRGETARKSLQNKPVSPVPQQISTRISQAAIRPGPDAQGGSNAPASVAPSHRGVTPAAKPVPARAVSDEKTARASKQLRSPEVRSRHGQQDLGPRLAKSDVRNPTSAMQSAAKRDPAVANIARSSETANLASGHSATTRADSASNKTTDARSQAIPPRPIKKVLPTGFFGEAVLSQPIQVEVEVIIDETGNVADARAINNLSSEAWPLAQSAVAAAKEWIFQPAFLAGKNISSHYTIHFRFNPETH